MSLFKKGKKDEVVSEVVEKVGAKGRNPKPETTERKKDDPSTKLRKLHLAGRAGKGYKLAELNLAVTFDGRAPRTRPEVALALKALAGTELAKVDEGFEYAKVIWNGGNFVIRDGVVTWARNADQQPYYEAAEQKDAVAEVVAALDRS